MKILKKFPSIIDSLIRSIFKASNFIVASIIIGLVALGIILWFYSPTLKDFGLNFTTEMIGVLLTIFVIDWLLEKKEKSRLAPLHFVIYQEISGLYNSYTGLFYDLYKNTCPEEPPNKMEDFFSGEYCKTALLYTNIRTEALVFPAKPVIVFLSEKARQLKSNAEQIIDKYTSFITPEILSIIYTLFRESSTLIIMESLPVLIQARNQMPYPNSLIYHLPPPSENDVKQLLKLQEWLLNEKERLEKSGQSLRPVSNPEGSISKNSNRQLRYRIDEEVLQQQIETFNIWREENRQKI